MKHTDMYDDDLVAATETVEQPDTETQPLEQSWQPPLRVSVHSTNPARVLAAAPGSGKRRLFKKTHDEELERAERAATATRYSQSPVVVVASPRGKAGKTTISVGLAAAFAQYGRQQVALIDFNPGGNLHLRSELDSPEQTDPAKPARTLEGFAAYLARHPQPTSTDIRRFLQPQPEAGTEVLPAWQGQTEQQLDGSIGYKPAALTPIQATTVLATIRKEYDIVVLDCGNNLRDDQHTTAMEHAHALIVPIRWDADTADSAWDLLMALLEVGQQNLVENVILVESAPTTEQVKRRPQLLPYFLNPTELNETQTRLNEARHGEGWHPTLATIPYDPALDTGGHIYWDKLTPATRRHFLHLAALTAETITRLN